MFQILGDSRLWRGFAGATSFGRRHRHRPRRRIQCRLPLVVSTTEARAAMERMLDDWSGGKSKISGEPEVRFWPEPVVTLPATTIVSTGTRARPARRDRRITASFSLLPHFVANRL